MTAQYKSWRRVVIWSSDTLFSKLAKTILDGLEIPSYTPRASRLDRVCRESELVVADRESLALLPAQCMSRGSIILVEPGKLLYSIVKLVCSLTRCEEVLVGIDPGKYIGVAVLAKGLLIYKAIYSNVADLDEKLFKELYEGLDGDTSRVSIGVGVSVLDNSVIKAVTSYARRYGFRLVYVDEHKSNREHIVGVKVQDFLETLGAHGGMGDHVNAAINIALRAATGTGR